jgi:hypothetical protein
VFDRLASILPETIRKAQPTALDAQLPVARAHLQQALQQWLLALSKRRPFVLAVDDFHRIDEPSAALLSLLEQGSQQHELCLLLSVETAATWSAESARKLLEGATTITLANLAIADCEKLLRSLFGVVPNVDLLAHRVQGLCAGNPRDLLRLAQHFIDRGLVRYAAGAWTLPSEIDPGDLPQSLAHALSARIDSLDEPARRLAYALALCPDQSFSFAECASLSGSADHARTFAVFERLTAVEIARRLDDTLTLSQRSWVPLLRARPAADGELALERELASMFERRGGEEFRAAQHWFRAQEHDRALDLLVEHAQASQEKTARGSEILVSYLRTLPEDWFETFELGLRMCDALDRPHKHKFILLSRLAGMMPMLNLFSPTHTMALFRSLSRDSGLDDWAELDPELEPKTRILQAIGRARARYDATPEQQRVNDPRTAIAQLARASVPAAAGVALSLDLAYLRSWPRLTPLLPLSPALEVSVKLIDGVEARCAGRSPRAQRIYKELLSLVERPDHGGLAPSDASYVRLGVMNGLGMVAAGLGLDSCLHWADIIATHPAFEVNAVLIRMLHYAFQGDSQAADECKRKADRLRIQNIGRALYEGQHLIAEVQAHALSGDLTRMRHVREEMLPLAKRYPQWVPPLRYAMGEYFRMVRDPEKALHEIERVLELAPAGMHQIWAAAAATHVLLLLELERPDTACELAASYLAIAERELEYVPERLSLVHALARARLGHADAAGLADAVLQRMHGLGFGKLNLGAAYELRARIALLLNDAGGFSQHTELCRQHFLAYKNSALTAKYYRLLQDGRRELAGPQTPQFATPDSQTQYNGTRVELAMASCRDEEQRARLALTILARQSSAQHGCLFTLSKQGLNCAAQVGNISRPAELLPSVASYLAAQSARAEITVTHTGEDESQLITWTDAAGRACRPILLCHNDNGELVITGVAVLAIPDTDQFVIPAEAAAAISRFYAGNGATFLSQIAD